MCQRRTTGVTDWLVDGSAGGSGPVGAAGVSRLLGHSPAGCMLFAAPRAGGPRTAVMLTGLLTTPPAGRSACWRRRSRGGGWWRCRRGRSCWAAATSTASRSSSRRRQQKRRGEEEAEALGCVIKTGASCGGARGLSGLGALARRCAGEATLASEHAYHSPILPCSTLFSIPPSVFCCEPNVRVRPSSQVHLPWGSPGLHSVTVKK